jgi:hypothetical protein
MWSDYLDWLPAPSGYYLRNELACSSAGALRWLGRLSFFAADEQILLALRSVLGQVLETASEDQPGQILLVASAGGGTGSGLLIDMTYLLEQIVGTAHRIAYVLLPSIGLPGGERNQANTYAFLRELFHLRYQSLPFKASYPVLGDRFVAPHSCEPWKRIYLYEPSTLEDPPFLAAIQCMAFAILSQMHPRVSEEVQSVSQREVKASEINKPFAGVKERCFGTSRAFAVPFTSIVKGREDLNVQEISIVDEQAATEDPQKALRLFETSVGRAVREATSDLIKHVKEKATELEERSRVGGLQEIESCHAELRELGRVLGPLPDTGIKRREPLHILKMLSRIVAAPITFASTNVSRILRGRRAQEVMTERSFEMLNVWSAIRSRLWLACQDYLLDLPAGTDPVHRNRLNGVMSDLQNDPGRVDPKQESYRGLLGAWKDLERTGDQRYISANRLQINVADRSSALRVLVERPEFRTETEAFLRTFIEAKTEAPALASAPAPPPAHPLQPPQRKAIDAVAELDSDTLMKMTWHCRQDLFSPLQPPGGRRAYAIVLLPRRLVQDNVLSAQSEAHIRHRIQSALNCPCYINTYEGNLLWIRYEDPFRSPCDLRNIDSYENTYRQQEQRDFLHIDHRFLSDPAFSLLCAKEIQRANSQSCPRSTDCTCCCRTAAHGCSPRPTPPPPR